MIGSEKHKLNSKTLLRGQQEPHTPDTYGLNKKALQIITVFLLSTTVFADNYSLSFDGDDYIDIPYSNSLNVGDGDWSISAWVNSTQASLGVVVGAYNGYGIIFYGATPQGTALIEFNTGSCASVQGGPVINDGNWHHIAAVRIANQNDLILYVDGLAAGSNNNCGGTSSSSGESINFGRENRGIEYFDGIISDVQVWDIALDENQIQLNMSVPPADNEQGLVSHWNFNEGSGSTLTDQTSNGNDGTINGAIWSNDVPTPPSPPPTGNHSLSFDGVDDYVVLPDIDLLGNYTLSMNVKPTSYNDLNNFFNKYPAYAFLQSSGTGNIYAHPKEGYDCSTGQSLTLNEWHNVSLVFNSGEILIYVDGGLIQSCDNMPNSDDNSYNLTIGKAARFDSEYLNGLIDDAAIWSTALSQLEIQQYINGNTPDTDNLVGHWNFNEGSGSTLTDQTSNGNNGTINGATWSTDVPPTPGEVSDDDILIETHTLQFTQYNALVSSQLEADKDYYLKITGTFNVHSCCAQFDAAYEFIDSDPPSPSRDKWFWNSLTNQRPYPDQYNSDHVYYFYFTSDGTTEEFGFEDGAYGDNSGSLTIQIWEVGDQDPPPVGGNHSLSFDGCDWCDDYISMGDILDPGDNSFTFEAWVYANTLPIDYFAANIVSKGVSAGGTPSNNGFFIKIYEGQSYISAGVSDGTIYYLYSSNILANQWYHVSIVINRELSLFSLFVNGILEDETDISNLGPLDNNGYFRIGDQYWANNGQHAQVWDGNIDEVRFWDTAISQEELNNNMYLYLDGNENGLLAYWPLDEGTGNTAIDQTGNGYDGTINGATWSDDVPTLPSLTSITINGTSGYRFLSSPVSGAIYGDLLDELWTQGAEGSDNANSNPNIWTWNNSWNALTDLATDNYTAGSGVLVYVFADTDFDGTDDLPVTLSVDGTQNTSPVTIATNTNSWNLLGNPYGLALDVNQLLTDNSVFNATVYVYDNELTAYKTHNGVTGDLAEGLVSPFSGFWIQAGADGNSFEFTEESIVNSYGSAGRSTTENETGSAVFTFHYQEHSTSVYLSFNLQGQINLDPADASRLLPMEARSHLTSMIHESGKSLSINNLPFDLSTDISMDMDVLMLSPNEGGYTTQEQDVTMEWDLSNIPEGMVFTLLDNTTGQTIDLDASETANITLPNKGILSLESSGFMGTYPELDESQFILTIQAATTATDVDPVPDVFALHRAYPNPFNPSTLIGYDLPRDSHVSLEIFDLNGRHVKTLINGYFRAGKHQVAWNADQISSGIYLVRLVTGKKVFNQKITFLK